MQRISHTLNHIVRPQVQSMLIRCHSITFWKSCFSAAIFLTSALYGGAILYIDHRDKQITAQIVNSRKLQAAANGD
jgi:hypothetical protein